MNRQCLVVAAIFAVGTLAFGQDEKRELKVEVKGKTPNDTITIVEPDDAEIAIAVDGFAPMVVDVSGQDAGGAGKQDGGTVVKEIDLGDGRTMKIIISKHAAKDQAKGDAKAAEKRKRFRLALPESAGANAFAPRVFHGEMPLMPMFARIDPHGFDVDDLERDVRDHVERAMKAFDRAREEFLRAYKEMEPKVRARVAETAPRAMNLSPAPTPAPAPAPPAHEVEMLRKEVKELEKMVRELKAQLERKKGE